MKMSKEHLAELKIEVDKVLEKFPQLVEVYESGNFPRSDKVKDLQVRFCFDMMSWTGIVFSKYYNSGLNDSHIYTALKAVCPKVERKY